MAGIPRRMSKQRNSDDAQVEVKLRLADKEAHTLAEELFSSGYIVTHNQENYFFDGSSKELSSKFAIMRLRFYNKTERAVLTLKVRSRLFKLGFFTLHCRQGYQCVWAG